MYCLCPMWLARVITLVLVLRHSNENHSIKKPVLNNGNVIIKAYHWRWKKWVIWHVKRTPLPSMGQIFKFRKWRQMSTEFIFGFLIFPVTRGFLWRFNHFTHSCLVNQTLTNSNLTRTREHLLHEFFIIERSSVTSGYHGTKMSASQQSFLTETAICIVERWKESMGYRFFPKSNYAQESNICHFLSFLCHICSTTVYWDPEILLPWQRDVTTSPARGETN